MRIDVRRIARLYRLEEIPTINDVRAAGLHGHGRIVAPDVRRIRRLIRAAPYLVESRPSRVLLAENDAAIALVLSACQMVVEDHAAPAAQVHVFVLITVWNDDVRVLVNLPPS